MDNRVFNINGAGLELLTKVLDLALNHEGYGPHHFAAYRVSPEKGLILYHYTPSNRETDPNMSPLLVPMNAEQIAPMVHEWLMKQHEQETKFTGIGDWDHDCAHDGSNSKGWRCYVEEWGHVDDDWGVVCAILPAFMWHGK